jgi:hypothetical protein
MHPGPTPCRRTSIFNFAAPNLPPARFPQRNALSPQLRHLHHPRYPPYGLRLDLRTPDQNRARTARFSVGQANIPALSQSLDPGFPPSELLFLPHRIHPHRAARQRFHRGTDAECTALGFCLSRPKRSPSLDLSISPSSHQGFHFLLTLYTPTMPSAGDFTTGPILSAQYLVFDFGGQNPRPLPIF